MNFLYCFLSAAGALMVIVSLTINLYVDRLIESTTVAIANGAPINNFLLEIMAVMSGGTLMIIPFWLQLTIGIAGSLIAWIGVQGLVLAWEGLSITTLFTRDYWTKRQNSFTYDPFE